MIRATITSAVLVLLGAPAALAGNPISVRPFSQQYSESSATAGASIDVQRGRPGRRARPSQPAVHTVVDVTAATRGGTRGGTTRPALPPPFPPLPATSPLLKQTQPAGPGSFWYSDGSGHVCMYAPSSVLPCFTLTGPASAVPAVAPLSPATVAAHVADQMGLNPGELKASPASAGLTGAASWFWLDPAPAPQQVSISLAGERVTVTATPQISWRFGDGTSLDGGPGVAYRPGPAPADAITHVYETRCLPGDQGHDPYVLASCGSDGYDVAAVVTWQIAYRAAGPVAGTGTLPARTTTSTAAYPVTEARAFLLRGSSG